MAFPTPLNIGGSGITGPEFNPFFREGINAYGRGGYGGGSRMTQMINMISDSLNQFAAIQEQKKADEYANAAMDRGDVPGAPAYVRRAISVDKQGNPDGDDPEVDAPSFATQATPHTGGMTELGVTSHAEQMRQKAATDQMRNELLAQQVANMKAGRTRNGALLPGGAAGELKDAAKIWNRERPKFVDSEEALRAEAKAHGLDPDKMMQAQNWHESDDGKFMVGQVPKLDEEGNPVMTPATPPEHPASSAPPGIGLATSGFIGTGQSEIFGDSPDAGAALPKTNPIKVPIDVYKGLNDRLGALADGSPMVREAKGQGIFRPAKQYYSDMMKRPGVSEAVQKLIQAGKLHGNFADVGVGGPELSEDPNDYIDPSAALGSDATPADQNGFYLNKRPGRGTTTLPQPPGAAPNGNAPVATQLPPISQPGGQPQGTKPLTPAGPTNTVASSGGPVVVASQKQFDALPSGAQYINKRTGQLAQKP